MRTGTARCPGSSHFSSRACSSPPRPRRPTGCPPVAARRHRRRASPPPTPGRRGSSGQSATFSTVARYRIEIAPGADLIGRCAGFRPARQGTRRTARVRSFRSYVCLGSLRDGRKGAFADRFPRHGLRGPERRILDSCPNHLHARVGAGCENTMQHRRELRALGFPGTPKQVERWLGERCPRSARTTVRRWQPAPAAAPVPSPSPLPSPKYLSWCLLGEPENDEATTAAVFAFSTAISIESMTCRVRQANKLKRRHED